MAVGVHVPRGGLSRRVFTDVVAWQNWLLSTYDEFVYSHNLILNHVHLRHVDDILIILFLYFILLLINGQPLQTAVTVTEALLG